MDINAKSVTRQTTWPILENARKARCHQLGQYVHHEGGKGKETRKAGEDKATTTTEDAEAKDKTKAVPAGNKTQETRGQSFYQQKMVAW